MNLTDTTYLNLLSFILTHGIEKRDRTGVGTLSVFGYQSRYPVSFEQFPLLTTKKVHFKSVVHELLWFLSGSTNTQYLKDNGVKIWDEWADDRGNLGPVYGQQWRDFGGLVDQISQLVEGLKTNPDSRRHIVTAWNPVDVPYSALPPCHCFFQFYVVNNTLSCQLYQRSADVFLGVPFNIASYSLLLLMLCQVCGFKPGEFIHTLGDAHIYLNHIEQVKEQLSREPKARCPQIALNPAIKDIFSFSFEDITLLNYEPHPVIKAPVAV